MMPGLDWPMLRNCFISGIQARLKTAVVLERLAVWSHLGLWQQSLVGRGSSETLPPWIVHVPCCTPSFWLTSAWHLLLHRESSSHILNFLLPITSLWEQPSMPLKCDFGENEFACVPSGLNVRVKRNITLCGIAQNCSCITCLTTAAKASPVSYIRFHVDVILRSLNLAANVNPVQKNTLYFSVICWFWFYSDPPENSKKAVECFLAIWNRLLLGKFLLLSKPDLFV